VGGAYLAQVRADACATLRGKVSKAKGKKTWDLNAEVGKIQNLRLINEGLLALSEPNTGDFQGIKGSKE